MHRVINALRAHAPFVDLELDLGKTRTCNRNLIMVAARNVGQQLHGVGRENQTTAARVRWCSRLWFPEACTTLVERRALVCLLGN